MKRILSIFVSAILICSCLSPVSVAATETEPTTAFVPMSHEQYDELVHLLGFGTEEEKQFAVDYILDANSGNSTTYSWSPNYTESMSDGTNRIFGFVTYRDWFQGMGILVVVPATLRGTPQYGYTWYTVDTDNAYTSPASGSYTYSGTVTATISTTTKLYIATSGTYEIAEDVAVSMGIDLEVLNYSHSVGSTYYYRYFKTSSHIEYSPVGM